MADQTLLKKINKPKNRIEPSKIKHKDKGLENEMNRVSLRCEKCWMA